MNKPGPYSAHRNLRAVNFVCNAPQAAKVSVIGDFNGWDAAAHPMHKGADGVWTAKIEVRHGHHRYAFQADDQLLLDPTAMGITRDDQGRRVSMIAVS
jgi:1,4-alpha-glucan branching enzyme